MFFFFFFFFFLSSRGSITDRNITEFVSRIADLSESRILEGLRTTACRRINKQLLKRPFIFLFVAERETWARQRGRVSSRERRKLSRYGLTPSSGERHFCRRCGRMFANKSYSSLVGERLTDRERTCLGKPINPIEHIFKGLSLSSLSPCLSFSHRRLTRRRMKGRDTHI